MQADAVLRAARRLADAWRANSPTELLEDELEPRGRDQAMAIQAAFADLVGEPVVGWKIGATSMAVQRKQGLDGPVPGRIFGPGVYFSPAQVPSARCANATLECEIAFCFISDPSPAAHSAEELAPEVELRFAVEVTGSRYSPASPPRPFTPYDLIADNGAGAAFVFGEPIRNWRDIRFSDMRVDLRIDGGAPAENFFGEFRRDPLEILVEVVALARRHGFVFRRGHYVSTGSVTVPQPIAPGQSAVARFGDFEPVRLRLV